MLLQACADYVIRDRLHASHCWTC